MFIFNDISYNSDCLNVAAIEHSPLKLVDWAWCQVGL